MTWETGLIMEVDEQTVDGIDGCEQARADAEPGMFAAAEAVDEVEQAERAAQTFAVAALRHNVEQLQQANDAKLRELSRQGVNVESGIWANIKVEVLAEMILGTLDDPERVAFEQMYQLRCRETIAGWEKQIREAQLAARAQPEPVAGFRADRSGLLLPG